MSSKPSGDQEVEARSPHGGLPLVSVVINNYNYARYLRQALDSALQQTYRNLDVVVVDDGSTDDSRAILSEYKHRIRLIEKTNGGQASAFNAGINAALGQYILLLDSDDFLFPNAIEECLAGFENGCSRVYFRYRPVDAGGARLSDEAANRFFRRFEGDFVENAARTGELHCPPTSTNFFCAKALRASLPVPEEEFRMCADTFVVLRSALHGPVKSLDVELGAYRFHGSNNFVTAGSIAYADLRRVQSRLDHAARVRRLLESTCKLAGLSFRPPRPQTDYGWVKCMCVAYRFKLSSASARAETRSSLMRHAVDHFREDESSWSVRVTRLLYLVLLLLAPMPTVKKLLMARDQQALA
jgi:hypothetical protein